MMSKTQKAIQDTVSEFIKLVDSKSASQLVQDEATSCISKLAKPEDICPHEETQQLRKTTRQNDYVSEPILSSTMNRVITEPISSVHVATPVVNLVLNQDYPHPTDPVYSPDT